MKTTLNQFILEYYNISNETQWMWVSPDNEVIKVPRLNHKDYIMRQYKNTDFGWDYDRVFDKALEDGWVRVIYEKDSYRYKGELSLNGYSGDRVKYVLKNIFWDLIRFGNNKIYIDYENPRFHTSFSTATDDGKSELVDFLY